jgi:hypothetical protein
MKEVRIEGVEGDRAMFDGIMISPSLRRKRGNEDKTSDNGKEVVGQRKQDITISTWLEDNGSLKSFLNGREEEDSA